MRYENTDEITHENTTEREFEFGDDDDNDDSLAEDNGFGFGRANRDPNASSLLNILS